MNYEVHALCLNLMEPTVITMAIIICVPVMRLDLHNTESTSRDSLDDNPLGNICLAS